MAATLAVAGSKEAAAQKDPPGIGPLDEGHNG